MTITIKYFISVTILILVVIAGCSDDKAQTSEKPSSENTVAGRSEHSRDVEEKSEGEESGTQYGLSDTFVQMRNGVRLILSFQVEKNAFTGTVENTTGKTIKRVRVEVHLSNGIELGPTKPVNLKPGRITEVMLPSSETKFETWTAHAEVGGDEHDYDIEKDEHN